MDIVNGLKVVAVCDAIDLSSIGINLYVFIGLKQCILSNLFYYYEKIN